MSVLFGDCRETLKSLPEQAVQCCVTSPPYWGLRDYGVDGQLGMEKTPEEYVTNIVDVFRQVWRVLKDDGTLWLNLGDSYAAARSYQVTDSKHVDVGNSMAKSVPVGLKAKDLVGIPWRVAFALQSDGWYLRSDIIWHKPNPMPESVTDRPTAAHEHIFLLTKSAKYYYDHEAVKEQREWPISNRNILDNTPKETPPGTGPHTGLRKEGLADKQRGHSRRHAGFNDRWDSMTKEDQGALGRNLRNVWTIATQPYPEAHFAVFPPKLIEPCILAGSRAGDTVLDPFLGSGTTAQVAQSLGRKWVGCELNPDYAVLQKKRTAQMGLAL